MIPSNKEKEIYSTEEVRIGKWIDGKPLYRKVITFPVPATSTMGTVVSYIFNIGNDIDYAFIEHYHMVDSVNEKYTMPVAGYKNNVYYFAKANIKNDGTGYFKNSNSNWGTNCSVVISVLYTKTTDILTLYQRGDINMDGVIDQTDYDLLNNYLTTGSGLSEEQKILADVDGDGRIRTTDLDTLQNIINNT